MEIRIPVKTVLILKRSLACVAIGSVGTCAAITLRHSERNPLTFGRHFQMNFLERKYSHYDSHSAKVCSCEFTKMGQHCSRLSLATEQATSHQLKQWWDLICWYVSPNLNEFHAWWRHQMETFFRVTGPLCEEFTGHRWITHTKASDAELWCFLWSGPD